MGCAVASHDDTLNFFHELLRPALSRLLPSADVCLSNSTPFFPTFGRDLDDNCDAMVLVSPVLSLLYRITLTTLPAATNARYCASPSAAGWTNTLEDLSTA
jgi:hypothetical protein